MATRAIVHDVRAAGRSHDGVVLTYDRKDFADATDHAGVIVADETVTPRAVRRAVDRIDRAYPSLVDVVELLSGWG